MSLEFFKEKIDLVKDKITRSYGRVKRFIPAIAFLGGFIWDTFSFGNVIKGTSFALLSLYFVVSLVFLLLLSATTKDAQKEYKSGRSKFAQKLSEFRDFALVRDWSDTWRYRFSYIVQFCFGSLCSALTVCYFKSSGSLATLLIVILLAILLVTNEFLQKSYERFGISLALFSLISTMFLNFVIPFIVSSMGLIWFILSVFISATLCFCTWRLSHKSKIILIFPALIYSTLITAYLLNWIPPVPLVVKEQKACVLLEKDPENNITCKISAPDFWQRHSIKTESIHFKKYEEAVYFVSSIYAPAKVSAQIEHRWYYKNPWSGNYELKDIISSPRMTTHGSREEGFRTFTYKKNVMAGRWKVETAVKDGAVIGSKTFDIEELNSESPERIEWTLK